MAEYYHTLLSYVVHQAGDVLEDMEINGVVAHGVIVGLSVTQTSPPDAGAYGEMVTLVLSFRDDKHVEMHFSATSLDGLWQPAARKKDQQIMWYTLQSMIWRWKTPEDEGIVPSSWGRLRP